MSALQTRLDSFLRVVELDEDQALAKHANAVREHLNAKQKSEDLKSALRQDHRSRGRSEEWMVIELERQRLVESLKIAEQLVSRTEKNELEKRAELAAAHQKAEAIRHAIEKMKVEQIRSLNRKEQREADEIAIMRHRRAG